MEQNRFFPEIHGKLGFGCMRLPMNGDKVDLQQFGAMVDRFLEQGFNYFDTAYTYHQSKSEAAFRQAVVERYPRDRFTITDKMPMWEVRQEADYERLFNVQLQRTGVDYFDYYWFHTLNKGYVDVLDRTNGWDFILRKQKEGRIRNIGFSFHDDSPTLERILKEHPDYSARKLAEIIGVTPKAIEKHLARLKADGIIQRDGPDKGGNWRVL